MAAIKSYKGLDKNLRCRDFQYEIGKEYEMDGEIKVCKVVFTLAKAHLKPFDHYPMIDSRFCEVKPRRKYIKERRTRFAPRK